MKMSKYLACNLRFRKILTTFYFGGCFIFFAFFYKYHLYYIEQLQLFRLSWDFVAGYFHKPASLSCLIGDFLTQFYFFKTGGAVIITGCLLLLWYLIDRIVSSLASWRYSYLFSLLVTALVTSLHFNLVYPLAATISLIIALAAFLFYTSLTSLTSRLIGGLILVPILYLAAGFAVNLFLLVVLLYEFKINQIKGWLEWAYSFILIVIVLIFPVAMRSHYYLTVRQAYQYPVTELTKPTPNFILESLFSLDCEWYFNHPEKTIKLARKATRKTRYVTYYYNLASAAINKLPENLLSFNQMGIAGMFIPVNYETNFISLLLGNEVYYFIGDINASQHYVLRANTFSPKCVGSRMIRRMVETNIINGEYAAAEKYIKMLNQTLFHRQWAHEMEQYLYDDELCNKTPWIASKRAQMPVTDHIKSNPNYFIDSIYYLLDDHPDNRAALDYLLSICLLYKDIDSFYKALTTYKYQDIYLPGLYQEALIVYYELHKEDKDFVSFQVSDEVIQHSMLYKEKYYQSHGNKNVLMQDFGKTYWYYLNFAVLPI
jgi:hypothetical protein